MSGLTVLVVDDEALARNDLAWLLSQADDVDKVLTASSGTEALKHLGDGTAVDALFLDIQMPSLNGLELARLLKNYKKSPATVFVTAYEEYAVDAFSLEACDYLLKPVDEGRLDQTIRRLLRSVAGSQTSGDSFATLTCRVGSSSFTIDRDEIVIVEAAGDLVRVHTAEDSSHLVRESISSLTAAWASSGFLRIHRSYLVRATNIERVRTSGGARSVEIWGQQLPVSRRYNRLLDDYFAR